MAFQQEERLGRSLGFFPTFAIGTGTMIGAGIFVLPGIAAVTAGPASSLSFLLGGIISMATALSMAELATGMPQAGGSYYFISRTMGSTFGSIIGIGAWLALIFKGSFALVGLAEYLNIFIPLPVLLMAFIAGIILLYINYRGAESSGALQNKIVIGLFIILILYIGRGLMKVNPENIQPFVPHGYNSVFATTGIIFVSFLGITQLSAISEEVKNPSKNLPRAFIASVGAVTALYVGVMLVITGLIPAESLQEGGESLVQAAAMLAGTPGRIAIIIAGFFATVSTANAAILSSSRFPFAMGRDDLLPDWVVEVHEDYETPYRAIIFTGAVMILLMFLFDVEGLAKLGSTFNVLIFVLINLSAYVLRIREQEWYEPDFRAPFFPLTPLVGAVGSLALLPQLGLVPFIFAAVVIVVGVIWSKTYARGKAIPEYNLLDIIEDEEVVITPSEMQMRVMVPVSDPDVERDLLRMADHIGDETIGLNVVDVPDQMGLKEARERHIEELDEDFQELDETFRDYFGSTEREQRYLIVFDHSISDAILEQSERESADLILMGWQKQKRFGKGMGGITKRVMHQAGSSKAVLRGHYPEDIDLISVAYDGKRNSRYGLQIARRISGKTGVRVRVFHIVSPDASENKKESCRQEMRELAADEEECTIECEIEERFSVSDTILEEAGKADLTVIGDSLRRFSLSHIGNRAARIARHSDDNLLIVKKYQPLSKETILSRLRQLGRDIKE